MKTQQMNLFIVDDNKLVISDLKNYLIQRFGMFLNISTYNDGESCMRNLKNDTHIVILDYELHGKNGLEILKEIKAEHPKIEVIMFSGNEDIGTAIQSFRNGATDYVIKGQGSWKKLTKILYDIITEPIRIIVREFKVTKFMAVFLLTFVIMGIIVVFVVRAMNK